MWVRGCTQKISSGPFLSASKSETLVNSPLKEVNKPQGVTQVTTIELNSVLVFLWANLTQTQR